MNDKAEYYRKMMRPYVDKFKKARVAYRCSGVPGYRDEGLRTAYIDAAKELSAMAYHLFDGEEAADSKKANLIMKMNPASDRGRVA